jgi:uncharacterized repeat protein (TIGR01451 family)
MKGKKFMATFYNQATLTYRGGSTNSNIVTGELREVLTANKTATTETYSADNELTYLVNIINTGATALTGLTVTDDLGAYPFGTGTLTPLTYVDGSALYFVGGVQQADPTVVSTSPLIVSGLNVPAAPFCRSAEQCKKPNKKGREFFLCPLR